MGNIERYKEKAKIFLEENTPAFIKDIEGTYYFCKIIKIEKNCIVIESFAGKRKGEKDRIYFIDIVTFKEYQDKQEKNKW